MDLDALQDEVFRCAREGRWADARAAIDAASEAAAEAPARVAYWRACCEARLDQPDAALATLEAALDAGGWWRPDLLDTDDDLDPLRDDPRFAAIRRRSADAHTAAVAAGPPPPLVRHPEVDAAAPAPLLVALHRAGSSPGRAAPAWESATAAGWRVLLPHGPHVMGPDEWLWLDLTARTLDLPAAERTVTEAVAAQPRLDQPVILAGYAQGAAVALHLALSSTVPAVAVLAVGSTHRYLDVLAAFEAPPPADLLVDVVIGDRERTVEDTRAAVARLAELGVRTHLDVREGLAHRLPRGFGDELPGRLAALAAGQPG